MRQSTEWCGVVRGGAGWCGVVRGGSGWFGVVRGGAGWCGVVRGGAGWLGLFLRTHRNNHLRIPVAHCDIIPFCHFAKSQTIQDAQQDQYEKSIVATICAMRETLKRPSENVRERGRTWENVGERGRTWENVGERGRTWENVGERGRTWEMLDLVHRETFNRMTSARQHDLGRLSYSTVKGLPEKAVLKRLAGCRRNRQKSADADYSVFTIQIPSNSLTQKLHDCSSKNHRDWLSVSNGEKVSVSHRRSAFGADGAWCHK